MPLVTRSKLAHNAPAVDSELLSQEKPASKRQKTGLGSQHNVAIRGDRMDVDPEYIHLVQAIDTPKVRDSYDPNRNAHLKGRKRFTADLADTKEACGAGLLLHGLKLKKVRPGDDEGAFEIVIEQGGKHVVSANFLVSDTSEYPGSHSLFCYSPDADISSRLQRVIDGIAEELPRPITETIEEFISSVARAIGVSTQVESKAPKYDTTDEEDEAQSGDDYDDYDDYDEFDVGSTKVEPNTLLFKLQENFVDIVATEYRPGFIRLGGDDFVLSVSLPVITLADSIPPRALMAWDRRLLSRSQHLTLLISGFRGVYPVITADGTYTSAAHMIGATLSFKVGLSQRYKPGRDQVQEAVRRHGLIIQDAEDELRLQAEKLAQQQQMYDWDIDTPMDLAPESVEEEEPEEDEGRFDRFSLSSSLESLIDQAFLKVVQLRRKYALGWAGAEVLLNEVEKSQMKPDDVLNLKKPAILEADRAEIKLARTTHLPHDPLAGLGKDEPINLPLTAFCYLIRRLALCTRYCIVCHNKLDVDFEALKPYVCDSKLCSYQYYSLNQGPSLEYEIIHNPRTVDLLVSLAYTSAAEGAMDHPFPIGMGLQVPHPSQAAPAASSTTVTGSYAQQYQYSAGGQQTTTLEPKLIEADEDGLCEFDQMDAVQMRGCIAKLIDSLPSVDDMKRHLERKVKAGKSKPKLKEINPLILPAAWSVLRWCVASCTAYIEEITSGQELIKNLDPNWRQFRLSVGAPDAEAKFKTAIEEAVNSDKHAQKFPVLYAFHGSPLKNWHSIVRHGLWYKSVAHGRAYGDGVYLAKDAQVSMGSYAQPARSTWSKSQTSPTNCVALAEVVNLPAKFVSSNPYLVVKDTHWIMCRYLLLKGLNDSDGLTIAPEPKSKHKAKKDQIPVVKLDPTHPTTVSGKSIEIPDPSYQIKHLLDARATDFVLEDPDVEDMAIFHIDSSKAAASEAIVIDGSDDEDYRVPVSAPAKAKAPIVRPKNDWKHDEKWVNSVVENLMPPPFESTRSSTAAVQRELKAMLDEQEMAPCLRELGWYMPPNLVGDNLFQWIVEMHSFDPKLPIAKDLKDKKLNSIVFEIRFPPAFPISPPFFRIITPRFLPFIQGGGGHITGGGSICMDLLTSDGWLPSYSISAVLLQIKLAISNLDPKPARLANNWNQPYSVSDSLVGFKRAAATHGWTVPAGIDRLVR